MATTLPDATEHAAVEEEGGVGIITRKKAKRGSPSLQETTSVTTILQEG